MVSKKIVSLSDVNRFMRWYTSNNDVFHFSSGYLVYLFKAIIKGIRAKLSHSKTCEVVKSQAEAVFIFPSDKSKGIYRQKIFLDFLSEYVSLDTCVFEKDMEILKRKLLQKVDAPISHYLMASYAKHLINKYSNASVIIYEKYDPILQYYLMLYRFPYQKLIHVAHSKITNDSKKFSINLCDYYFVFGESSLKSLENKSIRLGNSNVCISGAYFTNNKQQVSLDRSSSRKIVILGMGPLFERRNKYRANYYLIDEFLKNKDYEVFLKPHTMSNIDGNDFKKIKILPKELTMESACDGALAVISIYSNAVIDASYLGYPIAYFNANSLSDEWEAFDYFGVCVDGEQLGNRLSAIKGDYLAEVDKAFKFGVYHLGKAGMGAKYMAKEIALLAVDGKVPSMARSILTKI